jgi:ferredoxin
MQSGLLRSMGGAGGDVGWLRRWFLVAHRCHEGSPPVTECPVAAGVEMPSGEVGPIQVRVSPGVCEGWGQCHRWAPDVYPLEGDGCVDVHLMEVPSELAEQATWGASACPVRAITIVGPPLDYWVERRRASRTA